MAKGNTEKMWKKAMIITGALIIAGFGGVILSLTRWQIIRGEEMKSAALDNILQSTKLPAMRGTIYDASGDKILAQSSSVWTVALEPNYIIDDEKDVKNARTAEEKKQLISSGLSEILGIDKDTIYQKASQRLYFVYVKRRIETDVKDRIIEFLKSNNITQGVSLQDDYKRYYQYGTVASTILGHTDYDGNGQNGVEYQYNAELSGTPGRTISAKNAWGTDMPFQYEQQVAAQDGSSLVLTIDETVQSILEKYLDEGINRYVVANGAVAILMNVKTGAIVGLASKGDYDPNNPSTLQNSALRNQIDAMPEVTDEQKTAKNETYMNAVYKQWANKAVTQTYYPGSVFKIVTGAIGLNTGAVNAHSSFTCTGNAAIPGYPEGISCWKTTGHGTQTFREGLMHSCNPFFIHIGAQIGAKQFFQYFDAFGLTQETGIDLPGEIGSIYFAQDDLTPINLATASMGQNFGINAVQMITAVAAVANGGYLVQPHVVDKIISADGNIIHKTDTSYKRQVVSAETSKFMAEILKDNIQDADGTANNGYVVGYRISGKTGTSEKMDEYFKHRERGKQYIASFCGFAPSDNPEYALLVYFDEPQREQNGGLYGGNAVAGPIFSNIMAEILPYLHVKTEYTEDEMESLNKTAPSLTNGTLAEAKDTLNSMSLNYRVVGDDEDSLPVTMQIPQAGSTIPKDGKVILYTQNFHETDEQTTVPNFVGNTYSDAQYYAGIQGVQIITNGGVAVSKGRVQSQSIESGATVPYGTVIELSFADDTITEVFTGD